MGIEFSLSVLRRVGIGSRLVCPETRLGPLPLTRRTRNRGREKRAAEENQRKSTEDGERMERRAEGAIKSTISAVTGGGERRRCEGSHRRPFARPSRRRRRQRPREQSNSVRPSNLIGSIPSSVPSPSPARASFVSRAIKSARRTVKRIG